MVRIIVTVFTILIYFIYLHNVNDEDDLSYLATHSVCKKNIVHFNNYSMDITH